MNGFALPDGLDTPCVVVDVGRMQRNIDRMTVAMRERDVRLRPHAKTHKSVEIAQRQLASGASGITVATIGEAEVLADGGIEDVFIAYPVIAQGPKADRLGALRDRVRLSVGVESLEGAEALAKTVPGLSVVVEVDSGEQRTGRAPGEVVEIARACERGGLDVAGVFTHGGHSYAPGNAERAATDEVDTLTEAAKHLTDAGFDVRVVSAGSTPTALLSSRGAVNEERPGTYVFGDAQQVGIGAHRAEDVALAVATTVVSVSDGRFVIDAGAKALSKDRPDWMNGHGTIAVLPDARIVRLYDHHGLVETPSALPRVGDILAVVPNHVCPVVNLAEALVVVRDGEVEDVWPVDARAKSR